MISSALKYRKFSNFKAIFDFFLYFTCIIINSIKNHISKLNVDLMVNFLTSQTSKDFFFLFNNNPCFVLCRNCTLIFVNDTSLSVGEQNDLSLSYLDPQVALAIWFRPASFLKFTCERLLVYYKKFITKPLGRTKYWKMAKFLKIFFNP